MLKPVLTWIRSLATISICATCAAAATAASVQSLSPDDIRRVESSLTMPPGAKPIASSDRFYATTTRNGRALISGVFLLNDTEPHRPPVVRIVERNDMPMILDGGCAVVHVLYDIPGRKDRDGLLQRCCLNKSL